MANRHDHFIEAIEARLDTIAGLNIKTSFDVDAWKDYMFPYIYVEFLPEELYYPYEEGDSTDGKQAFIIWVGAETTTGGDLRKVCSALTHSIEKVFLDFEIDLLTTADFKLFTKGVKITGISQVGFSGETKIIYVIEGLIEYYQDWIQ